ncbi:aminotransferase class III-fold pyridoxal phosphate-dependent enzyme [Streptomyces luteogriseus]|uniref:aminotransferase class III-fold pyridoxal phosphate-dependent enzyme n=1 Tax=Streptomyces luteogriseus TaxID=68233 RepID=UPI0027D89C3D|nr:aminotransferase class III-fold pyridoxal phosphate-dependent enzyme [Streptomyces luteogriseus]
MQAVVEEVHAAGGVYIADEVQSGFARLGDSMWGFSRHGVLPDIVTMGKPMGNGLPISGVVFRPEVCEEFGQSVRYFNTFGGSSIPEKDDTFRLSTESSTYLVKVSPPEEAEPVVALQTAAMRHLENWSSTRPDPSTAGRPDRSSGSSARRRPEAERSRDASDPR